MEFIPILVLIHVTNECNLRCKHCYARKGDKRIMKEDFFELINNLENLGTTMIHLSGGELLTHPEIFEIIRYIKKKDFYLEITTNGTLLNEEIFKKLKELNLNKIVISFDGATPETHDYIRGEGNFKISLENLDLGLEMGIPMAVNYTVMKYNYSEIEYAIEFFLKKDLEFLNFRRFIKTGFGKNFDQSISKEEYLKLFILINKVRKEDKRVALGGEPHRIVMDPELREKALKYGDGGCSAGKYFLSIDPNGDITPCGFIPIKVGSIYEDNLKDVWENSQILNKLRDRGNLTGSCKNCLNKNICGGCRAAALGTGGDLFGSDPQCWVGC